MKQMQSDVARLTAFAILTAGLWACDSDTPTGVEQQNYLPQTSPENALHNLMVSYERKEIEEYAKLLRSDFLFVFQPGDKPLGVDEGWNRDQDSTGTNALFASDEVATITIDLTYGAAVPAPELYVPPGTMKIEVTNTFLEIDQLGSDITLQVDGDVQDMFFLPGDAARGEDPNLWYFIAWWDIPGSSGNLAAAPKPDVSPSSWGTLKALFEKPVPGPAVRLNTWGSLKSLFEIPAVSSTVQKPTWGAIKSKY